MSDSIQNLLLFYLLPIALAYFVAWMIHRLGGRLATYLDKVTGYIPDGLRMGEERRRTLNQLVASLISVVAFLTATIFALGRFIETNTLIWMIGLFSAAFGLGARPLIADFLTGMSFMFEDAFRVGEKVEILDIQGVVEKINLRTTIVRAQSGELYTIPNGEVRIFRNFSRSDHSSSDITLRLASSDLTRALAVLRDLGDELADSLPDMMEPWRIINAPGVMSQQVELTLLTKARFGHAAHLRLALLLEIQQRLEQENIAFAA